MKKTAVYILAAALLLCACSASPAAEAPTQTISAEQPAASAAPEGSALPEVSAEPEVSIAPEDEKAQQSDAQVSPAPDDSPAPSPETEVQPAETSQPEQEAQPSAQETQTPAPAEAPDAAQTAEPYSVKTADTVLTVKGDALSREWYFTLADIQSAGGYVQADYFSRGKEPQELTQSFAGIDVQYLFGTVMGCTDYKKAVFRAGDGYCVSYSKSGVEMTYINETDDAASLKMILAWTEDGAPCGLRLVMGQQIAGEYNRTNWVRGVCEIELKAG